MQSIRYVVVKRNGNVIKKRDKYWRYVCPHCLRTFVSTEYHEDWFCWKCGQGLDVVPKNFKSDES